MQNSIIISAHDLLDKLRYQYLPDLKNTYDECVWLWNKLGLDEKRDLQTGETRLLQFANAVDILIRQIQQFDQANLRQSDTKALQSLEAKISSTIMPIKQRLSNKLQEAQQEMRAAAQRDMQAAIMMQARQPPPQSALQLPSSYHGHSVIANSASSMNNFNLTMSAPTVNADMFSCTSSSSCSIPMRNSVAVSDVPVNNIGDATAPVESKKKRKRGPKKNTKEECSSSSHSNNSLNRISGSSVSKDSPNGINESLSIMNCYQGQGTSDQPNPDVDFSHSYDNDGDMYLYDLCLGEEDLELGADEARMMFSGDCFNGDDNCLQVGDSFSPIIEDTVDTEHGPQDRVRANKSDVDNYSCSTTDDTKANMSVRVGAPDEYISPRRRRRLNQIVPNPRNPRNVDYQCSCCSKTYPMTVQENPWWAVFIHECPHCKSNQVPRFDINAPNNAIELDPNIVALYGEGVDDDDDCVLDDEDEEDEEDENGENQPEEECFGVEGCLDHDEASKLLVLMCHARTCTGIHASQKHADVCKSTKFLMLHIRDCNGIDIYGNNCKFPWCMPCKKMLQHLTKCPEPAKCAICNPFTLPESFQQLQALNQNRSTVTDINSSKDSATPASSATAETSMVATDVPPVPPSQTCTAVVV